MSEISVIVIDAKPIMIAGNSSIYPDYNTSTTDVLYNKKCEPPTRENPTGLGSAKEISSNMTFTISGNYTTVDETTIKASSNCTININFGKINLSDGITNNDLGRITIPPGSTISGTTGTSISSLQNLKDKSIIISNTAALAINITFKIWNAAVANNVLTAKLTIGFARYYNHLTHTDATPNIAGITKYAPGQFLAYSGIRPPIDDTTPWPNSSSTDAQSFTGDITGVAGTFNNISNQPKAITFTSTPVFTHIVHKSL